MQSIPVVKFSAPMAPSRRLLCGLTLALVALLSTNALRAQTVDDEGLWFMVFGQGGLEGLDEGLADFRWWLDVQPRYSDDADGLDQFLVRPGLGYAFADNAAAWLGYAWIQTTLQPAGHSNEHRIWQQVTWSPKIEPVSFLVRPRLEERFLSTGDDVGWRFRQFLKATYPIGFEDRLLLAAYDEVFFDLNDTDWGQHTGFSQNRLFAGLGWRFDPEGKVTMEMGYLNQLINKRSQPDRMNHILSINLFLSF